MKTLLLTVLMFASPAFAQANKGHSGHDDSSHIHLVFKKSGIHAHAMWLVAPVAGQESVLKIEWKKASDHSPIEPGVFAIKTMVPDEKLDVKKINSATYEVHKLVFPKAGPDKIEVTLKDETKTIDVDVK